MSHTVTPERDSVAALGQYAAAFGIEPEGWQLLTGDRATIERLARDSYFVELSDGSRHGVETIAHTENVILLDGARRIRGVYNGTLAFDIDRLMEDIHALRAEMSTSRAAAPRGVRNGEATPSVS